MRRSTKVRLAAVVVVALGVATLVLRNLGYKIGGNCVVRCREGHLFTTLWVPGASLKAVRLGWWRYQYCPVGRHWTLVVPVREDDLDDEELEDALERHDVRIP